ncbi:MAG: 3D domain-containing protein [Clostridiales Family XIII bacterium]|nr:3D domain-containing protein [Clostridiales Family XIII bacterium]
MKDYWKRYRVLAISLSAICLAAFYMAIIPADAVISAGDFAYVQKPVGGVQAEKSNMNVAYDVNVPRNEAGEKLKFVGTFKVTHYCACTICCGAYATGTTATGKAVSEGMVAADWNVLPPHTKVYIKRGGSVIEKVVEDRGGAVNGNKIDVYVPSHGQALALGVYYADIYVDPETELP